MQKTERIGVIRCILDTLSIPAVIAGEEGGVIHEAAFQDTDTAKWLEAVAYSLKSPMKNWNGYPGHQEIGPAPVRQQQKGILYIGFSISLHLSAR